MKRFNVVLGLIAGLLVMAAIVATGTAEAQPKLATPLQTGDDNCIACHTSKELLQELAVEPEDEGEELSEGEG